MARYTMNQIADVARLAGFSGERLVIAIAVAWAESEGLTTARNVNAPNSIDRGLWQINNFYHPTVTDQCADDPRCAARETFRISNGGADWSPWTTYKNGLHLRHMTAARRAAGNPSSDRPASRPEPAQGTIVVYERENFQGRSSVVQGNERYVAVGYRFGYLNGSGPTDLRIRSIDIPAGTRVTLYTRIDYAGTSKQITGPVADTVQVMGFTPRDGQSFISSIKIGNAPISGIGGGTLPTLDGDLLGMIAQLETIDTTPAPDTTVRVDLGTIPNPLGEPVTVGGDIPIPGSGVAIMLARNAAAIAFRGLIAGVGLVCLYQGAKNL